MSNNPWTDPDPQPGDFDTELDRACPDQIELYDGHPAQVYERFDGLRPARAGSIPTADPRSHMDRHDS